MENTTAIVEYNPITSALASVEKYRGLVCDVTTPKGLAEAKAAHREVAALRIALEKTRKKVKEDVLARSKLIDGEANRIFALIAAIEDPIKTQIEAEERREQEAREAAIKAEQERLAAEERARKEAEEKRLAEERAKLVAEREAFERQQAEARAKLQAEEDARRKALAEEEARVRTARRAEEEKLAAERERVEAERSKLEEAARAEQFRKDEEARAVRLEEQRKRDADENARQMARREAERQEQDRLDARATLETFLQRYGDEPEFGAVAAAIRAYFERQKRRAA
jgi:hypothetical protein